MNDNFLDCGGGLDDHGSCVNLHREVLGWAVY